MNFIKDKLNIFRNDYVYSAVLLAVIILMFIFTYGNLYNVHSDIGREFYIPSQMIKGEVLYKDIYNIYPPMGYFINSLIIKIFGNYFITFYLIGLLLSVFILIPVYKFAKKYCNSEIAFSAVLLLIFSCVYIPTLSNWITPYSYSVLYALASIIWALYFIDKYIESGNYKNIIYSSLLYGFSLCSKYEYILFFAVIIIAMIYKKAKLSQYLFSILCIIVFPLISFIILLIQGCTAGNLIYALNLILLQGNKDSLEFFLNFVGFIPSIGSIKRMFIFSFNTLFAPIAIINILILFYEIVKKFDFKIILITVTGILISIKCLFFIDLYLYGTYFLPILLLTLVIFLYSIIKDKKYNFLLSVILILISASYIFYGYSTNKFYEFKEIKTNKGTVKIDSLIFKNIKESFEFINNQTSPDEKVLCIPEGVIINSLTERDSDNYLFYLIYPNVNAFGVDYIINRINNGKYNYIIYSNIKYVHHNQTDFKNSWGKEIFKDIEKNYETIESINNNLQDTYILKYKN